MELSEIIKKLEVGETLTDTEQVVLGENMTDHLSVLRETNPEAYHDFLLVYKDFLEALLAVK